jgi:hypothetical protein
MVAQDSRAKNALKKLCKNGFIDSLENPLHKMDASDMLHKAGYSKKAAHINKKIVFKESEKRISQKRISKYEYPCSYRERAYEALDTIRARFVPGAGVQFESAGPENREYSTTRVSARLVPKDNTAIEVSSIFQRIYKKAAPGVPESRRSFNALQVRAEHRTPAETVFSGAISFLNNLDYGSGTTKKPLELSIEHTFKNNLFSSLQFQKNQVWAEPVEAYENRGFFNKFSLQFYKMLSNNWFLSAAYTWQDYFLNEASKEGTSKSRSITLGRDVLKNPYGWHSALRNVTAYISYEKYTSGQTPFSSAIVDLIDAAGLIRAGLRFKYLISCRSSLEIDLSNGHDDKRGYKFNDFDIYAASVQYKRLISADSDIFVRASFTNESSVDAQGGKYTGFSAGFNRYF